MAAVALSLGMSAASYTVFDIANPGTWTEKGTGYTQTQTIDGATFTITTDKASSTTNLLSPDNNTYSWRVYKNSNFTIEASVNMKEMVITFDDYTSGGTTYYAEMTLSEGWTGSLSGVIYTLSNASGSNKLTATASNQQVRIKTIVVSTEAGEEPPVVGGDAIYEGLVSNADDWTFDNVKLGEGLSYLWKWDADYKYLKGSSYVNSTAIEADSYAVSPVIDLTAQTEATLSFKNTVNYLKEANRADYLNVCVREEGGNWSVLEVTGWPEKDSWNAVDATADLKSFCGKKIQFGLHYTVAAGSSVAPTWEVGTFKVAAPSGVAGIEADNNAEAVYYNFQGVRVANPTKGMYIKVQGKKVSKVAL